LYLSFTGYSDNIENALPDVMALNAKLPVAAVLTNTLLLILPFILMD
jgi:hypothetical protein